eukprot:scaffold14497_cov119-Cylindrotheca_fusiformis.AAC.4
MRVATPVSFLKLNELNFLVATWLVSCVSSLSPMVIRCSWERDADGDAKFKSCSSLQCQSWGDVYRAFRKLSRLSGDGKLLRQLKQLGWDLQLEHLSAAFVPIHERNLKGIPGGDRDAGSARHVRSFNLAAAFRSRQ